ncbi:DNA-binding transcription factor yap1 [Basidiobolus ranarum]
MKKPGRKPVATVPKSKRQMQNREAQRIYRERKILEQQNLLDRIDELESIETSSQQENRQLKIYAKELKAQNDRLQITLNTLYEKKRKSLPLEKVKLKNKETRFYSPETFRYTTLKIPPLNSRVISLKPAEVRSTAPKLSTIEFQSLMHMTESSKFKIEAEPSTPSTLISLETTSPNPTVSISQTHSEASITPRKLTPLSSLNVSTNDTATSIDRGDIDTAHTMSPYESISPMTSLDIVQSPPSISTSMMSATPIASVPNPSALTDLTELNLEDSASVEYLDQLILSLHELCKEMKEKASTSSEAFEFEWPCSEINDKLEKLNKF